LAASTSPTYVISIDGGTESARVGIFDLAGNLLSLASQPYATDFPRAGWAEQDPEQWWSAIVAATRACLDQAPLDPRNIVGLSLDATTCTLVPLGADGRQLRPALLWMDVRAADQANRIFQTGHRSLCYSPSGCNAEWMLSKALWLSENEPETYARTTCLIEYTDWLVYRLTGRLLLNLNTATQRWYYNDREWAWPADLFAAVGVSGLEEKFPKEIVPAGREVGCLLPEAARALGLPDTITVYQGGGDAFIGLLGLNVAEPDKLGLITGSSNVMGAFVAQEFHGMGLFGGFPDAVIPGLWLVEAGQVSTGSILAWFKRYFAADLPPASVYSILDGEAEQIPPGAGGVVVLDYFQGNRTPYTDSLARGAIWGLSLHTTRAHLFRALMEGIAYGTNHILETLSSYGHLPQEICACGGATRSETFMQIYADVCGVPISIVKVTDAPLVGGAILAATGVGVFPDLRAAAQAMVKVTRTFVPNRERHEAYRFYFERYRETYRHLRESMHQVTRHETANARG
jgi:ribulokinase